MSGKRSLSGVLLGLVLGLCLAAAYAQTPGKGTAGPGEGRAPATETLKERLSDKASDDQRVNNCKVPKELRGPKPRPEGCAEHQTAGVARPPR